MRATGGRRRGGGDVPRPRRVDLPCGLAGFEAPPSHLHLKFFPASPPPGWKVIVLTPAGQVESVGRWLARHCEARLHVPKAVGNRVLRADIEVLPESWLRLTKPAALHHVDVTPEGTATLFLDCTDAEAAALVREMSREAGPVHARRGLSGPVRLTAHQFDVLSTAVALGYYEIPHRVDLRALAQTMGSTLGTTAEVLRRAEAKVLHGHVDQRSMRRWDDHGAGPGDGSRA